MARRVTMLGLVIELARKPSTTVERSAHSLTSERHVLVIYRCGRTAGDPKYVSKAERHAAIGMAGSVRVAGACKVRRDSSIDYCNIQ